MLRRALFIAFCFLLFLGDAFAGLDVNTATAKQLQSLPGIGPTKAGDIVAYRDANGPFASLADLDKVPGIGPATLANISILVEFGAGSAAASTEPARPTRDAASTARAQPTPRRNRSGGRININTASAADLDKLPGIGPSKAAAILGDRDTNGPFSSCDDLQRVTGIGKATVASLADSCAVDAP